MTIFSMPASAVPGFSPAFMLALVALALLPIMAGLALWRRVRVNEAGTGLRLGLISAGLWLLYLLLYVTAILPQATRGQIGTLIGVGLWVSTLWDWTSSLRGTRLRALDWAAIALAVSVLGLFAWDVVRGVYPEPRTPQEILRNSPPAGGTLGQGPLSPLQDGATIRI